MTKFASTKGGIAIGLKGKRGHVVTKRTPRSKPSRTKGKLTKRTKLIREVVREVAGFAPYEKRMLELLRNELDKRALRFGKKRLGSHQRAKKKREEMSNVIRAQRQVKK
eukprot:CAMPEP_0168591758 /NCGR_PEP_ID=MMETSP0420-20121227/7317_1 /TAXON_ID=498008 /ORGANISM="Pessonella sp." /LENGTH=108 /DNA_ID=CAMNT_0008627595 /DNA_START=926 /DNA_END=1252 /DNA_ORIENTATION=+